MTGAEIYQRTAAYEREARAIRLHAPHWRLLLAFDGQRALSEIALAAGLPLADTLPLAQKFLGHHWIEEQPITLEQYLKRAGLGDIRSPVPAPAASHEPPHAPPPLPTISKAEKIPVPAASSAPQKAPPGAAPRAMRLSSVVDFITSLVGNISVGRLLVYRVFLRVPPELLLAENIASVHFNGDTSLIQTEALQKAIAGALNDVARRQLPDSVFAPA